VILPLCYQSKPFKAIIFAMLVVSSLYTGSVPALELNQKFFSYIEKHYGIQAENRMKAWQKILTQDKKLSIQAKLKVVNIFFNKVTFVSDLKHWGKLDYWATPIELLETNGGDCEDYAIAKYFTLRELGIPDNKMRITYVKALRLNQAHMVLAYYQHPEDDPLILDNLINAILPASKRPDLYPIYSFNGNGIWLSLIND